MRYTPDRTILAVEDHSRTPEPGTGDAPGAPGGPVPAPGGAAPTGDPAGAGGTAPAPNPLLAEAGGGHGLTAMRERAARAGGSARAGPTADGWRVELEVPG